jgi:hypothetical protein
LVNLYYTALRCGTVKYKFSLGAAGKTPLCMSHLFVYISQFRVKVRDDFTRLVLMDSSLTEHFAQIVSINVRNYGTCVFILKIFTDPGNYFSCKKFCEPCCHTSIRSFFKLFMRYANRFKIDQQALPTCQLSLDGFCGRNAEITKRTGGIFRQSLSDL